ncbi:MAG: DnaB-like helicase C-terminal domain-containing protein [Ignavibacteriaceae bacterium]
MNSKTIEAKEIEKELLGEILLDNSIMDNILQLIKPVCFADNKHSLLFNVMIKMYESGLPIDELTLYENVKKIGYAEQTPIKFIAGIRNEVYSVANYDYHTKIIVEKYLQRELIKRSEKILKEALKDGEDVFELIGKAEDEISNITKEIQGLKEDKNLWEDFPAIIDSIEKRYSGNERDGLLSKTFPTLNKMTNGIRKNDLVVIYGEDKQGKTSLSTQIALDFAIYNKIPTGIFSYEMSKEIMYLKALSMRTGTEYRKLRSPKESGLTPTEFKEFINNAENKFKDTKIYVSDEPLDKNRLKAKMKLWKRKFGIALYIIDYIGLIPINDKFERRDLAIADLSRFFKVLTKELDAPIMVLSQANDEGRTAESRALLRDCDFALMIQKPVECGIMSVKRSDGTLFNFSEDHFLTTLTRSRHGRNMIQFITGYINNNFVEINTENLI